MHSRSPSFLHPGNGEALASSPPGSVGAGSALARAAQWRADADADAPATMIVRNRADYLGEGANDIGQRIAPDKLELFVGTDAAQAMQQQMAQLAPEYIAVHDIGTSTGLRLLHAIAAALGAPLQQLAIRRQGYGVPLATLRFVEMESRGKRRLRVYSTDIDADSASRRQLARVLLGNARLAVLMVGDLPSHALDTALAPLREALREGDWPNRKMIMVPLSAGAKLAEHAAKLPGNSGVEVTVTAAATRPTDAWGFIAGAWNRARQASGDKPAARLAAASTALGSSAAGPSGAAPDVAAAGPAAARAPASPLVEQMMSLATVRPQPGLATTPAASPPGAGSASEPGLPASADPTPAARTAGDDSIPPGDTDARGSEAAWRTQPASAPAAPREFHAGPGAALPITGRMPSIAGLQAASAPGELPAVRAEDGINPLWARYLTACHAIRGLVSACVFDLRSARLLAHTGGRPDPQRLAAQGMVLYTTMAECGRALGLGGSQPRAMITLTQHHLMLHPIPGHPGIAMHAVLDGAIADPTLARAQLRRVDASVLGADAVSA